MIGAASGRLVLVVGPSGAGKDSLIRHARERLAGDPGHAFPRRVITRPPSESEDNVEADPAAFAAMAEAGAFAAHWAAHGLRYGIPVAIEDDLSAGRVVVLNVSRGVVAALRARYARVRVIEVTAPPEILAARLVGRGRREDIGERLARASELASTLSADVVIHNDGPLAPAREALLRALAVGSTTRVDEMARSITSVR